MSKVKRLAIIQTHPIQYYTPWIQLLAKKKNIKVKVFYTYSQRQNDFFDKDFGVEIKWDIPLLDGYDFQWVQNKAKNPNLFKFNGIICPDLIRSIREWNATTILVIGWNYRAHISAMKYFKGKIPVWFRGDSTLIDFEIRKVSDIHLNNTLRNIIDFFRFKTRRLFLTWIYKYVDVAFYVGTNNKAYFLEHGLKDSQLILAPHAIDNKRFTGSEDIELLATRWKRDLGILNNDYVILFCGKFEQKKNPLLILESFNQLHKTKPNLKLLMIGGGHLEKELKRNALDNPSIIILPFQNQSRMPLVYRLANLYCLPSSNNETWGLAVNEALACGRPVLVSDKVGCAIDLVNDFNGVIFESGNLNDLNQKLIHLINSTSTFDSDQIIKGIEPWSFEKIVSQIYKAFDL